MYLRPEPVSNKLLAATDDDDNNIIIIIHNIIIMCSVYYKSALLAIHHVSGKYSYTRGLFTLIWNRWFFKWAYRLGYTNQVYLSNNIHNNIMIFKIIKYYINFLYTRCAVGHAMDYKLKSWAIVLIIMGNSII